MPAAYNEGKLDALDEFISPNFVRHSPPFPDLVGLEAYKQSIRDTRLACPDFHLTLDKGISQGDWTASKGRWTGTWNGPGQLLPGRPGTGQKLEVTFCGMDRWEDDQYVETWELNDFLSMTLQTGVITWPD